MKMRNVIAAIVLSLSLIACCTPVMTFAQETEPQLIPETLWEGCEYYGAASFNADMEGATLDGVTSSNPNVIAVHMDNNFSSLYDYYLEPLAQGTSDISVTYSMGGQTKTATALFTVKPFPAFVTSLTIDGNPVDLGTYKNYYDLYNYFGTAPSIKFVLGDGWKLDGAYSFSEGVNLSTSEDGVSVDFPETCDYAGVFIDFVNTSGETIMYGVRLHRYSDESGYDPDEDIVDYGEGYLSNLGTPVSATFVRGSDNDELWGATGTTSIENIYEPGNKFIVTYDGGDYETVEYICVRQKESEQGYNLGFYPFGSVVYDMSQLYPKVNDIIIEGADTLKRGENNAKLRVSFAHGEDEEEQEPKVFADVTITGFGDAGDHVHQLSGTIIENVTGATCSTPGTRDEVVRCTECGEEIHRFTRKYYADHELTKTAGKPATCTEPGVVDYWTCNVCHKHFSDEWGNYELGEGAEVIPAGHALNKIEAREATTTATGNIAYWECSRCSKCFSDEEGSKEITRESTIIPKKEAPAAPVVPSTPVNPTTQETPVVAAGEVQSVAGSTVKVTSATANTVSFTKAKKSAKAVTVPATVTLSDGETYKVTQVEANAFKGSNATSVTLSKNITTLKAKAFNGSKVKTVTVKTPSLTKKSVKNSLKGSKVTTVKVKVGSKSANKKAVAAYKKIFTKKIVGRKVTVK